MKKSEKRSIAGQNAPVAPEGFTVVSTEWLDMITDILSATTAKADRSEQELEYLRSFIEWGQLQEKYRFFRKHVHQASSPDLPFPWLECPPFHEGEGATQHDVSNAAIGETP